MSAGPHALPQQIRVEDRRRDHEGRAADEKVYPEGNDIEPPRAAKEQQADNDGTDESLRDPKNL